MRSGLFRVIGGLAACAALMVSTVSPASAADQVSKLHVTIDAYADVVASSCPFTNVPPSNNVECEDWNLQFVKERIGSNATKSVWQAFLFRARYTLHPDGTADTTFVASGVGEPTSSYFDEARLTKAGVKANIELDDGSHEDVDIAWDGTGSPLQFSGNASPFNVSSPRHLVTTCFTTNDNSQLQYRSGVRISGTIDGTDVNDKTKMTYFESMSPFMAKGTRQIQFVTHGTC
jgi:hypothetical protein